MTSEAYYKSSPSIHRPHVARFPRKTWCPGEPIPRRGSSIEPDPHAALARNAEAHAEHEARTSGARKVAA
jgi:hypothetical protein